MIKNEKEIPSEKISYNYISKHLKRYSQNDNLITSYNYQKDWLIRGIDLNIRKEEGYKKDQTFLKIEENDKSNINFIAYRFQAVKDFIYTTTIVAKKDSKFRLLISYMNIDAWDGGSNASVVFDLEAVIACPRNSNPIFYEIKPLKEGWYLCTLTAKCLVDNFSGVCFILFDSSFLNKREFGTGLFVSNPRLIKSFNNEFVI